MMDSPDDPNLSTISQSSDVEIDLDSRDDKKPDSGSDLYTILGIVRNATEREIGAAYKSLALKYHPERNPGDEGVSETYKLITNAYNILSDPNRRRQYDLSGRSHSISNASADESEGVDISALGGLGRVFGAVVSRLGGISIPTQIAAEVIDTAKTICANGGIEGGGPPLDPRVSDLVWGWGVDAKVDRQAATYYRLTVEERHVDNGFVVICRSPSKGKFKLLMFDSEGSLVHQEESLRNRDRTATQAILYFTIFDTYRLGEAPPAKDKDLPLIFTKLDAFVPAKREIKAGQYLICVYGDNFLGRTNYSIVPVAAKNDLPEVAVMRQTDSSLAEHKLGLDSLKLEYLEAKAAYQTALLKIEAEGHNIELLLSNREHAYRSFLNASVAAFAPVDSQQSPEKSATEAAGAGSSTPTGGSGTGTGTSTAAAMGAMAIGLAAGLVKTVTKPAAAPASSSAAAPVATNTATADGSHEHANNDSSSDPAISQSSDAVSSDIPGAAAATSPAPSVGAAVASAAANTATAAGGWIAKKLSLGISQLQSIVTAHPSQSSSPEEPSSSAAAFDGSSSLSKDGGTGDPSFSGGEDEGEEDDEDTTTAAAPRTLSPKVTDVPHAVVAVTVPIAALAAAASIPSHVQTAAAAATVPTIPEPEPVVEPVVSKEAVTTIDVDPSVIAPHVEAPAEAAAPVVETAASSTSSSSIPTGLDFLDDIVSTNTGTTTTPPPTASASAATSTAASALDFLDELANTNTANTATVTASQQPTPIPVIAPDAPSTPVVAASSESGNKTTGSGSSGKKNKKKKNKGGQGQGQGQSPPGVSPVDSRDAEEEEEEEGEEGELLNL